MPDKQIYSASTHHSVYTYARLSAVRHALVTWANVVAWWCTNEQRQNGPRHWYKERITSKKKRAGREKEIKLRTVQGK